MPRRCSAPARFLIERAQPFRFIAPLREGVLEAGRIAVKPGPTVACEDTFTIEIAGKGAHVVVSLQTIVSRTLDPVENAVASVTDFKTSGARNVIPGSVVITGDARSFSSPVGDAIEASMRRIAAGAAAAHGATADMRCNREFTAAINTPREAAIVAEHGATL